MSNMSETKKEKPRLHIEDLLEEAESFAKDVSGKSIRELFGKTDGKNVGTYVEKKFKDYLENKYEIEIGNSARGIDLPELNVDIKVTSERKPQSSSPFRNARQQIFGLSHSLLIFVYKKEDDSKRGESKLQINKVYLVDKEKASDKKLTKKINAILLKNDDDKIKSLTDCISKKNKHLSEEIISSIVMELADKERIDEGVIGISNAPQWRLSFSNVVKVKKAKKVKMIKPNE